ncbi:MAG: marine proteobacterial sortase target protein [Thermoanaerobaculia bacterium]
MDMKQIGSDYTLERWLAILFSLLFLLPWIAEAQELPSPAAGDAALVRLDDVGTGSLLVESSVPGAWIEATTVQTEVAYRVTGIVARASVRQTFRNPASECVDALYVFPLPESAAVDRYRLRVGIRTVEGEIREKAEARRIFEQARAEGRRASLVEQHRPNLFSVSLSNLGAGETIEVELEFQQTVRWADGQFELRLPLVAPSRYVSPASSPTSVVVPDPPVDIRARRNPVSITVELLPGLPVRELGSESHEVTITQLGSTRAAAEVSEGDRYEIRLTAGSTPADRDFVLGWRPRLGSEPRSVRYTERAGEESYSLLMLFPPSVDVASATLPREAIFVVDTSGSMEGTSIQQARLALERALRSLRPGDLFEVIEFNSSASRLFGALEPADDENIARAVEWVRSLRSRGGTEMLPALREALETEEVNPTAVRQVVFVTDGQVSNEDELLEYVHRSIGSTRLFTVGIGSAPNGHLMASLARAGRGVYTFIGDTAQVEERMTLLFRKLDAPVLTDLVLAIDDPRSEYWPSTLPDLYAGEPLVLAVRSRSASPRIQLAGRGAEESWLATPASTEAPERSGVAKLWARRKIEALSDRIALGGDEAEIRPQIVELGLAHGLVTRFTSFVAVDKLSPAIGGAGCLPEAIPVNAPHGSAMRPDGSLPQTATPRSLFGVVGLFLLLGAALVVITPESRSKVRDQRSKAKGHRSKQAEGRWRTDGRGV